MELKQQEYLLIKKRSIHQTTDHKSLGSSFRADEVIIIDDDDDDDEKETLEVNKSKKQRVVSWWDEPGAFNEFRSVAKGLPNSNNESKVKKYEKSLALIQRGKYFDLFDDKSHNNGNNKTIQDPLLGRYKNKDNMTHVDSCFTLISSNDLIIKDAKEGSERSLSSSHHHDNFIDLSEDEIVGESSITSKKVINRHVTLEELGVTMEDLKSMPWEAFDPTWEIRSESMDPWLGGYVKDMLSSAD